MPKDQRMGWASQSDLAMSWSRSSKLSDSEGSRCQCETSEKETKFEKVSFEDWLVSHARGCPHKFTVYKSIGYNWSPC